MKLERLNLFYIFLAIMGLLLLKDLWASFQDVSILPYSEFQRNLAEGNVREVFITSDYLRGEFNQPDKDGGKQFVTVRVNEKLAEELSKHGVRYSQVVENTIFHDILSWILPALIFFALWFFVIKKLSKGGGFGGQLMSIGKSRAKVYVEEDTKVRFSDVAGIDEVKDELFEVVSFLKDQEKFGVLGARTPKGVLLVGPPGTGKTLLAKAVAGEAKVPFFSISGSEFVEMFVGVGAARVRDLFEQARKKAPCIIFIDELDALGRSRTSSPMGGHDEKEQTLNQLLVELDGFDSSSGIVILAATNRPEILDAALLRSGRFDRQILVDKPDKIGRLQILKVHVKKIKLADSVDLTKIAELTPGFTGADIANLANEAALVATRREAKAVEMNDFNVAIERIIAGLEKKNRILTDKERQMVAYHEMGHALVAAAIKDSDPVHKVSIIPRGMGALGYTIQRPKDDRYLVTKQDLENKMAVLMGGRAAEKIVYDHYSTGASDDLSKVTRLARDMVVRYGMDTELGHVTYEESSPSFLGSARSPYGTERAYSDNYAQMIDIAVKNLAESAFKKAVKILTDHLQILHDSAKLLLEKETLSEEDLKVFFTHFENA